MRRLEKPTNELQRVPIVIQIAKTRLRIFRSQFAIQKLSPALANRWRLDELWQIRTEWKRP
jgi:hypothetical protein